MRFFLCIGSLFGFFLATFLSSLLGLSVVLFALAEWACDRCVAREEGRVAARCDSSWTTVKNRGLVSSIECILTKSLIRRNEPVAEYLLA